MKRLALLIVILTVLSAAACSQAADQQQPGMSAQTASIVMTASPAPMASPAPAGTPAPSPTPAQLSGLPEEYLPETAAANGDYVEVHGAKFYNENRLTAFLGNVYSKKQAAIRLVSYTTEGDPIISDVVYDGSKFTVFCDTTRDQFGKKEIAQYEFLNLFEFTRKDDTTLLILSDDSELNESDPDYSGYLLTVMRTKTSVD